MGSLNAREVVVASSDTPQSAPQRCVEARNYEMVRIYEKLLPKPAHDFVFASPSVLKRIKEQPFSGHSDARVQKLKPMIQMESVEPAVCFEYIDRLERLEKDRDWKGVEQLYRWDFGLADAVAVDKYGSAPADNNDRSARIGFHRFAAHLKMSVAYLREGAEARRLNREAKAHSQRGLELLGSWTGHRPSLWRVTRLKLANNLALVCQIEIEGQDRSPAEALDQLKDVLETLINTYNYWNDLVWYGSEIVPEIYHYLINALEIASIGRRDDRWDEAMSALVKYGDASRARADFISKLHQKPVCDLPSFAFHFEKLAAYNASKSTVRTVRSRS
jgi:hypothetical protein